MEWLSIDVVVLGIIAGLVYKLFGLIRVVLVVAVLGIGLLHYDKIEGVLSPVLDQMQSEIS